MGGGVALVVLVELLPPRHGQVQGSQHVVDDVGVGVLVDGHAGGGVGDEDADQTAGDLRLPQHLLDAVGDVDHLAVGGGADVKLFGMHGLSRSTLDRECSKSRREAVPESAAVLTRGSGHPGRDALVQRHDQVGLERLLFSLLG